MASRDLKAEAVRQQQGDARARERYERRETRPSDRSGRSSKDAKGKDRDAADDEDRTRRRTRRRPRPVADTIDSMDKSGFGGAYHHGGPYDATLAAVNRNKRYAPLEAVRDSLNEALRATPPEYIADSLQKHVPLQGTSVIPPGVPDMFGRTMQYEEGADLMREPDAAGGAYKRYDFISYHPDDLKGKGENFELERDLRALKEQRRQQQTRQQGRQQGRSRGNVYELQDRPLLADDATPRASVSNASAVASPSRPPRRQSAADQSTGWRDGDVSGHARHSSTSGRLADGLRRRLGSLRRK